MVANNVVDYNTSTGLSIETNVMNIAKNTVMDGLASAGAKKIGSLVKTSVVAEWSASRTL